MPGQKDGMEQGMLLAAASMAAEALALSRVVCAEGEALVQCDAPEVRESTANLLASVTQAQHRLHNRLECALTVCGYLPGGVRLVNRYSGFWWEEGQGFPWKSLSGLEGSGPVLLLPGQPYRLTVSLSGFPVGTAAEVFLCLSAPPYRIPLFTLRTRGPQRFKKALNLVVPRKTPLSLEVSGGLGACVLDAGLEVIRTAGFC